MDYIISLGEKIVANQEAISAIMCVWLTFCFCCLFVLVLIILVAVIMGIVKGTL